MPLTKDRYVTALKSDTKLTALLTKIASLYASRGGIAVVIEKGLSRYKGQDLSSLTITPAGLTGNLVYDPGAGAETYDKADILKIQRLRSRKWKIVLKPDADPLA